MIRDILLANLILLPAWVGFVIGLRIIIRNHREVRRVLEGLSARRTFQ